MQLSKNVDISVIEAATAAGTTAIESAVVDMQGYENALFITTVATKAVDNICSVLQGTDATVTDAATLAGSSCISLVDASLIAIEILAPAERYLRFDIARGTSTAVSEIICIKSKGVRSEPTDWAAVITILQSPAEGSA